MSTPGICLNQKRLNENAQLKLMCECSADLKVQRAYNDKFFKDNEQYLQIDYPEWQKRKAEYSSYSDCYNNSNCRHSGNGEQNAYDLSYVNTEKVRLEGIETETGCDYFPNSDWCKGEFMEKSRDRCGNRTWEAGKYRLKCKYKPDYIKRMVQGAAIVHSRNDPPEIPKPKLSVGPNITCCSAYVDAVAGKNVNVEIEQNCDSKINSGINSAASSSSTTTTNNNGVVTEKKNDDDDDGNNTLLFAGGGGGAVLLCCCCCCCLILIIAVVMMQEE
jgi:hypothetical protein